MHSCLSISDIKFSKISLLHKNKTLLEDVQKRGGNSYPLSFGYDLYGQFQLSPGVLWLNSDEYVEKKNPGKVRKAVFAGIYNKAHNYKVHKVKLKTV